MFNGLDCNMDTLYLLSNAQTRAINAENPDGEKGGACKAPPSDTSAALGMGWKCRPAITIQPGETVTIADIQGPGAVKSIWMGGEIIPELILRIYWDDRTEPSVCCPLNTFFAYKFTSDTNGFDGQFPLLNSLPVVVAPCRGMNCYWQMPFKKHCRITVENTAERPVGHFYQINYVLTQVPEDIGYFHARYREEKPVAYGKPYTVIDGIKGKGQYVGTALFATLNGRNSCWVEGEMKFYMDGDGEFPTITFTGIEDYLCGSYAFAVHGRTHTFSAPYSGLYFTQYSDGTRGLQHDSYMGYRWHIPDPIRFEKELKVTVQDLGWNESTTLLEPRSDDFSSVAYWYQTL